MHIFKPVQQEKINQKLKKIISWPQTDSRNRLGKTDRRKIYRRGHHGCGRERFRSGRERGVRRNFNSSNNKNKRQEVKMYPHGTGPDWQTATFIKVKDHIILTIQSGFVNRNDIAESILKGVILDLSKEIPIKRTSEEDEPSWAESYN